MLGFRQRSLHAWPRRLRTAASRALGGVGWLGARPPRTQRVYVVRVGDERVKRIVFPDSHHAALAAARLEVFAADGIYPRPILERERELWVEYVEGRRVARADDALRRELAQLLAVLWRRAPRRVPLADTAWLAKIEIDLGVLRGAGVLDRARAERLVARARACAPDAVWMGYDCTDAILKNFVWSPSGALRAVDVESLGAEQLLGWSAAKAAVRWLGPHRDEFLEDLRGLGVPDIEPYFEFVELAFRAFWQKSSLLERKWRFVDPALFEPFLGGA